MVTESVKLGLELAVARPRPHMYNILQDEPARLEQAGIFDNKHGSSSAGLVTRCRSTSAGMVGAFRRCEQKIDWPDPPLQPSQIDFFKPGRDRQGIRKIALECFRGERRKVNSGRNLCAP